MKTLRNEEGQTLIFTALVMAALLGFVALALDVGLLFRARRNLQIAADAASTAGALDYYKNGLTPAAKSYAIAVAQQAAVDNQLQNATFNCPSAVTGNVPNVCVTIPPTGGVHTGAGFVEVDVIEPTPTTLMRMFGFGSINIAARSVAGSVMGQACIFVNKKFSVQGNSELYGIDPDTGEIGTACGMYVGGTVDVTGNKSYINAQYIEASGTRTGNHDLHPSPVVQNAPPQSPPKNLMVDPPAPSGCTSWNASPLHIVSTDYAKNKNGVNTISATLSGTVAPGCYGIDGQFGGGLNADNTIMNLDLSGATLADGLYLFDLGTASNGGLLTLGSNVCNASNCSATAPPQGSGGVTLEIYTGNFSVNSTNNDYLYAPSDTSSENGILLWEPSSNTGTLDIQWGSSSGKFYGYIVAPGATVTMQDHGGSALATGLVVGNLIMGPSTLYIVNYNSLYPGAPMRTIALVE